MARHRNQNWNLPEGKPTKNGDQEHSWESINVAMLMDIRDELQALRRILECPNVRGGFEAMQRIDRRLKKKIPLR